MILFLMIIQNCEQQLRNINIQTESVENEIGCTNKRNRDDSKKENQLVTKPMYDYIRESGLSSTRIFLFFWLLKI